MKQGDLVLLRSGRIVVAFEVTQLDIANGLNAPKPGLYGFRGCWYGTKDPTKRESFGKIEHLKHGVVIGVARNCGYQRKMLSSIKILRNLLKNWRKKHEHQTPKDD